MLVGAGLALLIAAAGALVLRLFEGGLADTVEADPNPPPAHPASDDVEVNSCALDDAGRTAAPGVIRNRSSETSDYAIHVFSRPNDEVVYVRRLEPSATTSWTVTSDEVAVERRLCTVDPTRRSSATIDGWCPQFRDDARLRAIAIDSFGSDAVDAIQLCGIDSSTP